MSEQRKRIKTVFYIESLAGGGAERSLITFLKHLDRTRYDISVRALIAGGRLEKELPADIDYRALLGAPDKKRGFLGKTMHALAYKAVYGFMSPSILHKLMRPKDADVEIAFVEGLITKIIASGESGNAARLAWVHCDLKNYPWPVSQKIFRNAAAQNMAYSKFHSVAVVSEAARCNFEEVTGKKAVTFYNPIDRDAVTAGDNISIEKTRLRIVTVGRVTNVKGVDRLLEAVKSLRDEGLDFECVIIGTGDALDSCRTFIDKHNLSDCVTLTGFLDNPHAVTRTCDIMVCPSRQEGFNLAVAEGMMLGLPIVSTASSGPAEILENGRRGILVENSTAGLVYGMRLLLTDPKLRERCAAHSLRRAQDFGLTDALQRFDALIDAVTTH